MCEIPNIVVLATQFGELFDGFSISSNDLTQLTLGVDRDSEQLVHVFDERDPGVKAMIEMVVQKAHGRRPTPAKVGICGEAPSNYPESPRGSPKSASTQFRSTLMRFLVWHGR